MERRRGTTVAIVAALIIAVVSLGIAFAAFSTTLTINGDATVQASSWNVFFTTATNGADPGTTGIPLPSANITESNTQAGISETVTASATIKTAAFDWTASFTTPGDKVVYKFYARNTGDYTAKITNISKPTKSCKIHGTETADTTVCPHVHYDVYSNSACTTPVEVNDTIAPGGYAEYYVVAYLDDSIQSSDLPSTAIDVDWTEITITYTQQ